MGPVARQAVYPRVGGETVGNRRAWNPRVKPRRANGARVYPRVGGETANLIDLSPRGRGAS